MVGTQKCFARISQRPKKIKQEKPDGWKKKYPGPTEESLTCRAPPSGRYRVPSPGGDAIGSTKNNKRNKTKLTKTKQREPTKVNKQASHPHVRATFCKNKNERKDCQQNQKSRSKKTTFKAAAAVCGSGSLGRCPLVGLVPCYPVCHLLPALVNRGFPATFTHSMSPKHHAT